MCLNEMNKKTFERYSFYFKAHPHISYPNEISAASHPPLYYLHAKQHQNHREIAENGPRLPAFWKGRRSARKTTEIQWQPGKGDSAHP